MTMVVDTSALMAIVLGESDAGAYATALIGRLGDVRMSAASLVEANIVAEGRQGPAARDDLDRLVSRADIDVVAFDREQAALAAAAWRRFGKGRHPAALNLGDCFSYALAKQLGAPLLFKGDDFTQTDITSAL